MELKKILIFSGKFPAKGSDTDGGSILMNTLINTLKENSITDVVFTRTKTETYSKIEGVRNVFFETYKFHPENKFERRLKNKEQLISCLKSKIKDYDKVIIVHCSKAFGTEKLTAEEKSKIILFPMYLSPSYKRSNENPPKEYIEEESKALKSVGKILTPSDSEKEDMKSFFGIDENKIIVIPRGYSSNIKPNIKKVADTFKMLYIASIKEQKNTAESIKVLNDLLKKGINAELHLAGSFQNEKVLEDCKRLIELYNLKDKVTFYGVLPQDELAKLISEMHVNISVSNWETFGRGIFEGMAGGLPTVVYNRLECVKQYVKDGDGIRFVNSHAEFVSELEKLSKDQNYYQNQAEKAYKSVEPLSENNEQKRLLKELL